MITPVVTIQDVDHAYTADGDIYLTNDNHHTIRISVDSLYVELRFEFLTELAAVATKAADDLKKLNFTLLGS